MDREGGGPSRRGRPRSDRAEQAILAAAAEMLEERGYARTSVQQIAARAGVGKQTIYRWWPNKAAVVVDAFEALTSERVPVPDTGSLERDLTTLIGKWVALITDPGVEGALRALIAAAQHDRVLAAQFHGIFMASRGSAIREVLARGSERGLIRDDCDLGVLADALYGPVMYRFLLSGESLSARVVKRIVSQALDGARCVP